MATKSLNSTEANVEIASSIHPELCQKLTEVLNEKLSSPYTAANVLSSLAAVLAQAIATTAESAEEISLVGPTYAEFIHIFALYCRDNEPTNHHRH